MKFGERVKIKGYGGFYDGAKIILIDVGQFQNPHTKNMEYAYVVEINDKYHKNVQDHEIELFKLEEDMKNLMGDSDVQQIVTD